MILRLIIEIICGVLNALGGGGFLWMRRYLMPFVVGITFALITHVWWCLLLPLPTIGTLCLGYFSGNNWGRALWLFVQAVVLGLGITLTGHVLWYFYLPYILGAGILGGLYKNWKQMYGDFITGCWLGLIILFVK